MVVDKGSLQYSITVTDDFSANTSLFRSELLAAKAAFADFKNSLAGIGTASVGIAELADAIQQVSVSGAGQGMAALKSNLSAFGPAAAASAASVDKLAASVKALGGGPGTPVGGANNSAAELKKLQDQLDKTKSSTDATGVSFGRVIATFAAFTAVRVVAQTFRDLISSAVDFNRVLETTRVNIASAFFALGQVSTTQGEVVHGAQALALAQAEAARQTDLLRRDSLAVNASFEQLAQTFDVALGPGLKAGLDVDQIRQFTVEITNAAQAIGLSQGRLAQEVNAILSGTNQGRRTRLEIALGITPDAVKQARDAGTLVDLLNGKLKAFGQTGDVLSQTYSVLFTKVKDSLDFLIGQGTQDFFNQLKGFFADLIKASAVTGTDSILRPNPEAVTVIRDFASGLANAVAEARRLVATLSVDDFRQTAIVVGDTITLIARVVGQVFGDFVKGLNDLSAAFRFVSIAAEKAGVFDAKSAQGTLVAIIEIAAVVKGMASAWGVIASAAAAASAVIAVIGAPITIVLVALVAGSVLLKLWLDHVTGINIHFGTIRDLLATEIVAGIRLASLEFDKLSLAAKSFAAVINPATTARDLLDIAIQAKAVDDKISDLFHNTADELSNIIKDNPTAETFGQATLKALSDGKDKVLELLSKAFPEIRDLVASRSKEIAEAAKKAANIEPEQVSFFSKLYFGDEGAGGKGGVQAFLAKATDIVQGTTTIIEGTINGLASFISDSIVAAFDPANKQTAAQRFGTFLQGLAKAMLDFITKLLIAKALMAAISALAGGFGAGASGPSIPDNVAASAFDSGFSNEGFIMSGPNLLGRASGGVIPDLGGRAPSGLHPTDTAPIWAAPGEFMQRVAAVRRYGLDFMDVVNRQLADPAALRAAAGLGGTRRSYSGSGGPGYAGGGLIADRQSSNAPDRSVGTTILPVVAANDSTMDKLMNGGKGAFLRFLETNSSEVKSAMKIQGGRS